MGALTTDLLPPAPGVLRWLAGSWAQRRSIDNGASMVGTATFLGRADGRFDYAEHGRLTLADGRILDAERRYLFEQTDDGFAVWFAEATPRLFHRVALHCLGTSLAGRGTHACGDDRYDTRYEFRGDGSFLVTHAVHGPRKRYVMENRHTRLAAEAVAMPLSPA
jgi:hypothetical protein